MTSSLIALVTRLSDEAEAQWLDLLRAALPGETVLSLLWKRLDRDQSDE